MFQQDLFREPPKGAPPLPTNKPVGISTNEKRQRRFSRVLEKGPWSFFIHRVLFIEHPNRALPLPTNKPVGHSTGFSFNAFLQLQVGPYKITQIVFCLFPFPIRTRKNKTKRTAQRGLRPSHKQTCWIPQGLLSLFHRYLFGFSFPFFLQLQVRPYKIAQIVFCLFPFPIRIEKNKTKRTSPKGAPPLAQTNLLDILQGSLSTPFYNFKLGPIKLRK